MDEEELTTNDFEYGLIKEDMNPVKSLDMLNFLHWLSLQHPETQKLSCLPQAELLQLRDEFKDSKADIDASEGNL